MDYRFKPVAPEAIVTGGASGIGKEISVALASRGVRVAVCDINFSGAEAVAAQIGQGAKAYRMNLAKPAELDSISEGILAEFKQCGILVNCAGIIVDKSVFDTTLEDWEHTLTVNLTGIFMLSRKLAGHMIKLGGGRIVNIASEAAHIMFPDRAAYIASKAGLIGFTRALALETAAQGIRANTVSPTVVMTAMGKTVWAGEKGRAFLEGIPVQRFAEVEDVAAAVLFLCSDGAAMITGTDLLIDGGNTAR